MDFQRFYHCAAAFIAYVRIVSGAPVHERNPEAGGKPMTRDELNRELRMHSASWQAVLIVYGAIIGTFVLSAMAVL
jgi:hypothetical protein